MRLVELVRVLAPVVGAAGFALGVVRRRLLRRFQREDATAPERAIAVDTANPLRRFHLRRLVHAGVLEQLPDGRLWLQREALAVDRARRVRRAILAVMLVLLLVALLFWRRA
ncbi:MAG: hypothetical protein IPK12_07920 [Gemmatimonadetes bacterium]|nr:hypothetical protein [Gemmatimonadota bacterium]